MIMTWSWKLARIAGIDVYVHATFLMVIAWIALVHWSQSQTLGAVIAGVGFILALFACIVLHEYGHALTARRTGSGPATSRCFPLEASLDSNACPTSRSRSYGSRSPGPR